ncbi:MAG: hypothetical protein HYV27_14380 [Candidatus Hydrogenedentes bacterium]|nr:hypothetical protein [Candidatus Hydrogenedentota bacterium]
MPTIDAVALMRQLREKLGEEMAGMNAEARVRFIAEKASASPFGKIMQQAQEKHEG